MYLLAVDTTHSLGSLSLENSQGIQSVSWTANKSHSEILFAQLEILLKKSNSHLSDITALLINNGPGSFTGIRVSVNLVKTLSYSLNIPIFAYDSLSLIANQFVSEKKIAVALNAHSGLSYFKNFDDKKNSIQTISLADLKDIIPTDFTVITDTEEFKLHLKNYNVVVAQSHSEQLLNLHKKSPLPALKWIELSPFYVRKSSPEEKMNL